MEILLEVLFGFLEIIFDIGCAAETADPKIVRKTLKVFSTIILLGLFVALLIVSITYAKDLLIILCIGYVAFLLLAYIMKTILDKKNLKRDSRFVHVMTKGIRYAFAITLIVLAIVYLSDPLAKGWLIGGTSGAILIYIIQDINSYHDYTSSNLREE